MAIEKEGLHGEQLLKRLANDVERAVDEPANGLLESAQLIIPVSGWVQQTGIDQREVSGGCGRGHHPTTVRQIAAISEREVVSATRADLDALSTGHWTPQEDRGSGEGHLCRGGQDILDAARGPRVRRGSSGHGGPDILEATKGSRTYSVRVV
ncbi:hypothetical protein DPMN_142206 [Dreissena polymorpha]|uniref:Uncharacterized protein n=1 Tax=Dreissena polymorpha TaxID=45954 RepID=A0A9D4JKL1_DREPO|nr:hypothetical protein DPMN_142206 [Dreissena polymorpha]